MFLYGKIINKYLSQKILMNYRYPNFSFTFTTIRFIENILLFKDYALGNV